MELAKTTQGKASTVWVLTMMIDDEEKCLADILWTSTYVGVKGPERQPYIIT